MILHGAFPVATAHHWTRYARWTTVSLLIALHTAAWLVLPSAADSESLFLAVVADALPASQMGLLVGWLVLGTGHARFRVPSLLALIALRFEKFTNPMPDLEVFRFEAELLGLYSICVLCTFSLLRVYRYRFFLGEPRRQIPLQFSLRTILIVTTVACILVAALNALRARTISETTAIGLPFQERFPVIVVLAGVLTTTTGLAFWLVPRIDPEGAGALLTLVAATALGLIPAHVFFQETDTMLIMCWSLAHGIIVAASLAVLRAAGFRLLNNLQSAARTSLETQSISTVG